MSTNTAFIKSDEVARAAGRLAQDGDLAQLGKNFYDIAIRDAVRELCYDTNYDKRVVEEEIPQSRVITLPMMGDSLNVFLFNEHCEVGQMTPAHQKPNYSHHGGTGNFANQNGINNDPLQGDTFLWDEPNNLYYYGIIGDKVYLSPQCLQYQRIRIEYAGLGQDDVCVMPWVPTWAKEAIMYRVAMWACEMRQGEGIQFERYAERYREQGTISNARSAWVTAMTRYTRMSPAQRRDSNIYTTSIGNRAAIRSW